MKTITLHLFKCVSFVEHYFILNFVSFIFQFSTITSHLSSLLLLVFAVLSCCPEIIALEQVVQVLHNNNCQTNEAERAFVVALNGKINELRCCLADAHLSNASVLGGACRVLKPFKTKKPPQRRRRQQC